MYQVGICVRRRSYLLWSPVIVDEKWTGPWTVTKVVFKSLSAVIEMKWRKKRTRTVSVASFKTLTYSRSSDLETPDGGPTRTNSLGCGPGA